MNDLRLALRSLAKSRGFTAIMVATLALGIGVTAAVFGLVDAVLIHPLPYRDADRLVELRHTASRADLPMTGVSPGVADYYRTHSRVFEDIGVYVEHIETLTDLDRPQRVQMDLVTPGFFSVLRPAVSAGRLIGPTDYQLPSGTWPGVVSGVVISHDLWTQRYSADPKLIGRTIEIDRLQYPVVGVAEPSFHFPHPQTQVWIAWGWPVDVAARASLRALYCDGVARLKPHVSQEDAERDLQRLVRAMPEAFSDVTPAMLNELGLHADAVPLKDAVIGDTRVALLVLLATAAFLLLITWANAVNLTLVRAERKRREVAVARALGASDAHLVRRFVTESLCLALVGGALGLGFAAVAIDLHFGFAPDDIPRLREVSLDGAVVALAVGLAVLSSVLLGAVALASARRADLAGTLSGGLNRMTAGRREQIGRRVLVAAQVALALTLLIGSALMAESFWQLKRVKLGFRPEGALVFRLPVPGVAAAVGRNYYHGAARIHHDVLTRLRALPGVAAADAGDIASFPLTPVPSFYERRIALSDRAGEPTDAWPFALFSFATPGYFDTMGIPLVQGRTFRWEDTGRTGHGVILSASLARALFDDEDPIGRRVRWAGRTSDPDYTVVGVAGDVPSEAIQDGPSKVLYFPNLYPPKADTITGVVHDYIPGDEFYVLRTHLPAASLVPAIERVVHEVDPKLAITQVGTLDQRVAASMARARLTMLLLGVAAGTALFLGILGIYGVLSYAVSQRTAELGVRIALGATPAAVVRMVVRQGALLAAGGAGAGTVAALVLTRFLRSQLYEVSPSDPVPFVAMTILLFAVALIASYLPARRAATVDPMVVLRHE